MKIIMTTLILQALLAAMGGSASAEDCMKCSNPNSGSEILCTGETKFDAITKCGDPDFKEITSIDGEIGEKWYYNCGTGNFNKELAFRGGELISIKTLDTRGSGPPKCF